MHARARMLQHFNCFIVILYLCVNRGQQHNVPRRLVLLPLLRYGGTLRLECVHVFVRQINILIILNGFESGLLMQRVVRN